MEIQCLVGSQLPIDITWLLIGQLYKHMKNTFLIENSLLLTLSILVLGYCIPKEWFHSFKFDKRDII